MSSRQCVWVAAARHTPCRGGSKFAFALPQCRAHDEMKWWTFRVAVEIIVGFDDSEGPRGRRSRQVGAVL